LSSDASSWILLGPLLVQGHYLAAVLDDEVAPALAETMIEAGIARRTKRSADEPRSWLIMHRDLAWTYKILLSEEVARQNRLVPTTDQLAGHAALQGTSAIQLALAGIGGGTVTTDITSEFALLSINAVVPDRCESIPISKIVEVRRNNAAAFDAWRASVDALTQELATELTGIESPAILQAYLEDAVRRYQTEPLIRLRKGLTDAGLDATTTALTTKAEIPAALGAGALLLSQPHIAAVAGAAVAAAGLRRATRRGATAQLESPTTYLLRVNEALSPSSLLERVLAVMQRAVGLRG
jgi:hypothetical protein